MASFSAASLRLSTPQVGLRLLWADGVAPSCALSPDGGAVRRPVRRSATHDAARQRQYTAQGSSDREALRAPPHLPPIRTRGSPRALSLDGTGSSPDYRAAG